MVLWIALLLGLYGVSALFAAPASRAGLPAGTSYSAAPDGVMALFDLVSHHPAAGGSRLRLEPAALAHWPQTPKNLLIVEPQIDNSARTDAWWLRLARQGYRVVELTDQNTPLVAALGLKWHSPGASTSARRAGPSGAGTPPARQVGVASSQGASAAVRLAYAPPGAPADGSSEALPGGARGAQWLVRIPARTPTLSHIAKTDARWLASSTGARWTVVGVTRKLGAGSVTVLTLPSIAYNGMIGRANNLGPLLFLLQPRRYGTGFAETVHGFALVPGVLPLLGPGAGYTAAVLGAALLLYIWSRGRRLGGIAEVETLPEPASLALALALARHYRQRGDYDALAEHLRVFLAGRDSASPGRAGERPAGRESIAKAADPPAARARRTRQRAYLELARTAVATLRDAGRPLKED